MMKIKGVVLLIGQEALLETSFEQRLAKPISMSENVTVSCCVRPQNMR
jgi:hypothetical protein